MIYELEKQLGIHRAVIADLELKNTRLREIVDASSRKLGGFEEQLSVKEHEYSEALRLTKESLTSCHRKVIESMKIMKADEVKFNTQQEKHKALISELNETITKQDTVIKELTDEVTLINQQNVGLRGRLEDKSTITNRLDKVLKTFE